MSIDAILLAVGTVITSVIGAVIAVYMMSPNRKNVEAQTTASDANAAESYAKASQIVAEQLLDVQKQIDILKSTLDARDKLIFELTRDKADLQNWAERLVHQLQSLGAEPVPFRSERKEKATKGA